MPNCIAHLAFIQGLGSRFELVYLTGDRFDLRAAVANSVMQEAEQCGGFYGVMLVSVTHADQAGTGLVASHY
ncbi:hypothetical protein BN844_2619 [Pseudomonas sp. SHC52]|nr:hypothetical protein BN844_2619 [Pseudomonas sp. SHC52]